MVNTENLNSGSERSTESELKGRLDTIMNEIKQLTDDDGTENDKIELEKKVLDGLNGQFADFLMGGDGDNLKNLQTAINTLINDPALSLKAGPQLWKLNKFLDDITNPNRMKKDYEEFMDRIKNNPKSVNRMKSREIRRLNLYLGQNKNYALNAYKMMKPIVGKQAAIGMKSEDQKFFKSVWDTLKNNYKNDEIFIYEDYPQLKDKPSVNDLRIFFLDGWDGSSDEIKEIQEESSSIVSTEKVKEVIKQKNDERISDNKAFVESIKLIDIVSKADFKKSNDKIWYNNGGAREEFTSDKMIDLYKNNITAKVVSERIERFVDDNEIQKVIQDSKDKIFGDLISDLLQANDVLTDDNKNEDEVRQQPDIYEHHEEPAKPTKFRKKTKPVVESGGENSNQRLIDNAINTFGLKVFECNQEFRTKNGLPPNGVIYREGAGYFCYIKGNELFRVPNFKSDQMITFYTQKYSLQDLTKSINSYPPCCEAGCQYLQTKFEKEMKNVGLNINNKKINIIGGKYCLSSFGRNLSINLSTFQKGWLFGGGAELGKDLKMMNLSNYLVSTYKSRWMERGGEFKLRDGCDLVLTDRSGYWGDFDIMRDEDFKKYYGNLTFDQGKKFCASLNKRVNALYSK